MVGYLFGTVATGTFLINNFESKSNNVNEILISMLWPSYVPFAITWYTIYKSGGYFSSLITDKKK